MLGTCMLGTTLQTLIEFTRVEKNLKDQNGPNFKDQKFIDENKKKNPTTTKTTRQLFQGGKV